MWTELFLGKNTGCHIHGTWQDRADMAFGLKPWTTNAANVTMCMCRTLPLNVRDGCPFSEAFGIQFPPNLMEYQLRKITLETMQDFVQRQRAVGFT